MAKVTIAPEKISPKLASDYLETNISKNRNLIERHIIKLTNDMKSGNWQDNGETIKFAKPNGDGVERLIDGQHRLHAIMRSKKTMILNVARNLEPATFLTVDTGKTRNAGDMLRINGETNPHLLAAALRLLKQYSLDPTFYGKRRGAYTIRDIVELNNEHPDLKTFLNVGLKTKYLVPGSKVVFLQYVLSRNPDNMVNDFMLKLTQGIGMLEGDPVLTLRDRLMDLRAKRYKIRDRHLLGLLFKTWNYSKAGEKIYKLRYSFEEPFPILAGVDYKKLFGYDYPSEALEKVKEKGSNAQRSIVEEIEENIKRPKVKIRGK